MLVELKRTTKTTRTNSKYSDTIFINGKARSICRLNKNKKTKDFIKDII